MWVIMNHFFTNMCILKWINIYNSLNLREHKPSQPVFILSEFSTLLGCCPDVFLLLSLIVVLCGRVRSLFPCHWRCPSLSKVKTFGSIYRHSEPWPNNLENFYNLNLSYYERNYFVQRWMSLNQQPVSETKLCSSNIKVYY